MQLSYLLTLALTTLAVAVPVTPASQRKTDPNSITNLQCTDNSTTIPSHDVNVALLQICGGIAKTIVKCQGNPTSTTGASGQAVFNLKPATAGGTITISKGRWEQCVRAAALTCGTSPYIGRCVGGASNGDVDFALELHK